MDEYERNLSCMNNGDMNSTGVYTVLGYSQFVQRVPGGFIFWLIKVPEPIQYGEGGDPIPSMSVGAVSGVFVPFLE